jgi:hypothetical protein
MTSFSLTRFFAPAVLAMGLGLAAFAPSTARASDDLVRVLVDVADVIYHSGQPYYRYGRGYGYDNRIIIVRDRYHRPTYYRYVPRAVYYSAPPYGRAHGYYRNSPRYDNRYVRYDRYDRNRYDYRDRYDRYDRYDRHDRDRWDDDRHDYRGDRHHKKGRRHYDD